MKKMDKQIFRYLKKYYLNFNEKKYSELFSCKTYITFQKLWGKEHGGLYRIDEPFNPPEILLQLLLIPNCI